MFHDMMDVLAFAVPGVYIEAGTSLNAEIDEKGEFSTMLNSGRIAYKTQYLKGLTADLNSRNDKLSGEITCNEAQVASLKFKENRLQLFSKDNYIGAGYSYNNDGDLLNHGQLILRTKLARNENGLNLGVDVAPTSIFVLERMEPASIEREHHWPGHRRELIRTCFWRRGNHHQWTQFGNSERHSDTLASAFRHIHIQLCDPGIGNQGSSQRYCGPDFID